MNFLFWCFNARVTPVLIPNTEVKPRSGDGTGNGRVARRQNRKFNYWSQKFALDAFFSYNTTMSWATQRKLIYGAGILCIVAFISFFVYRAFFYTAPTCFDQKQNGSETGVDCGGSCTAVCTSDALTPVVLWSKVFNISGSVYTLAAYVENPNITSGNTQAGYTFTVYDAKNLVIATRSGTTFIPANKKFVVFEPGLSIPNAVPKRVDFEFTSFGQWQKQTQPDPTLSVTYSALESTSTVPRIDGTVTNDSQQDVSTVELTGLVSDSAQNVIAVSRTYVDTLAVGTSQQFVFTWPKPFNLGVESCTAPVDVALVLDRSGSMRSESLIPPEPFTTVKNTAESFVQNLSAGDSVAVFSFGDNARTESAIASGTPSALSSIDALTLASTSEQTDMGDGLQAATVALLGDGTNKRKVIVLLTDGVPNEPTQKVNGKIVVDYPQTFAKQVAQNAISQGVTVYAIGLGKDVDASFLQGIATDSSHYFFAPDKTTLSSIYSAIGQSLCQKKPSTIQVLYRLP